MSRFSVLGRRQLKIESNYLASLCPKLRLRPNNGVRLPSLTDPIKGRVRLLILGLPAFALLIN